MHVDVVCIGGTDADVCVKLHGAHAVVACIGVADAEIYVKLHGVMWLAVVDILERQLQMCDHLRRISQLVCKSSRW